LIKFIGAAAWICIVTLAAVFYAFQSSAGKPEADAKPALFGGLDYVRTDVISVPIVNRATVDGYFLTRLVYTVEPGHAGKLSVPVESLITDQVYTYLYANPQIDFSKREELDLDVFRNGIRDSINTRVGEKLVHEVIIEQIDFLSRAETRDNTVRYREAQPVEQDAPEPETSH
jgi:hypothetical protein